MLASQNASLAVLPEAQAPPTAGCFAPSSASTSCSSSPFPRRWRSSRASRGWPVIAWPWDWCWRAWCSPMFEGGAR